METKTRTHLGNTKTISGFYLKMYRIEKIDGYIFDNCDLYEDDEKIAENLTLTNGIRIAASLSFVKDTTGDV